jgi:hypothetical protein
MAKVTINLKPPLTVAKEAGRGLKLHHRFGRGGTAVGWARAGELKSRRTLSPETIFRMVSFFSRHEVDKKGKNFFNKEKPSNGCIAWLLWGGDAGKAWAEKIKKQLKSAGF